MKKIITTLTLGLSILGLAACAGKANDNQNNSNPGNTDQTELGFDQLYAYSAVSGINLLSSYQANVPMKMALTDEDKTNITRNFEMIEGLMGNVNMSEVQKSDLAEYENMTVMTITNVDGTTSEYKYYFKETGQIIDKDDDDDDDWFDDDWFEDDDEITTRLEGIVINDGVTYEMSGLREVEGNEEEVTFTIKKDQNSYVQIEQENEDDEKGYEYTLWENGRKVYETELEYEIERGHVEYEFEEKSQNGSRYYTYEIKEVNGQTQVEAKIRENRETLVAKFIVVTNEDGTRSYTFIE